MINDFQITMIMLIKSWWFMSDRQIINHYVTQIKIMMIFINKTSILMIILIKIIMIYEFKMTMI